MSTKRPDAQVEILWHYLRLDQPLASADVILVLCSHDLAIARHAGDLLLAGWAPLLVFSGGLGAITSKLWDEPEADQFARIAADMGVPQGRILIENRSTNTGENMQFTRALLERRGLCPQTVLLVQAPYMERRAYATCRKVWPGPRVIASSPPGSFDDYVQRYANPAHSRDDVIHVMVGDLQRIRLYPARGFQIEQEIPAPVWAAFEQLVALGYDRHLVRE